VISVALAADFSFSEFGYSKKGRVSTHHGVIVTQVGIFFVPFVATWHCLRRLEQNVASEKHLCWWW
jgi:hypothetical protein